MVPVVEAKGLQKRYGKAFAVHSIDLAINEGEVFGLLGPNGSGKTTTILMLIGLTEPTAGSVKVAGFDPLRDPMEVKRNVGYLPDMVGFYDSLTARENLAYLARLASIPRKDAADRIVQAIDRVGLHHVIDKKVATFSHGMRQRLGIAEMLVKQAKVLILDEPTNGLDPQATQDLLKLIAELRADGLTIVVSSHMLNLVQSLCDRVALFKEGRVALCGRVDDLAREVLGGAYSVEVDADGVDVAKALGGMSGVAAVSKMPNGWTRVDADSDIRAHIARRIVEKGGSLREMTLKRASLDDVYARFFENRDNDRQEVARAA